MGRQGLVQVLHPSRPPESAVADEVRRFNVLRPTFVQKSDLISVLAVHLTKERIETGSHIDNSSPYQGASRAGTKCASGNLLRVHGMNPPVLGFEAPVVVDGSRVVDVIRSIVFRALGTPASFAFNAFW